MTTTKAHRIGFELARIYRPLQGNTPWFDIVVDLNALERAYIGRCCGYTNVTPEEWMDVLEVCQWADGFNVYTILDAA